MILKQNKYRNKRTQVGLLFFASKKEATRFIDLQLLERAREIKDLECQVKIPLICNNKQIGFYIADFQYFDLKKQVKVVEDVKSEATKTAIYRLKKKILETYDPPVIISEVF